MYVLVKLILELGELLVGLMLEYVFVKFIVVLVGLIVIFVFRKLIVVLVGLVLCMLGL